MLKRNYVSLRRLSRFLDHLKKLFATANDVSRVEVITNDYVLNIDYSLIQFDTSEIIGK